MRQAAGTNADDTGIEMTKPPEQFPSVQPTLNNQRRAIILINEPCLELHGVIGARRMPSSLV